MQRLSRDKIHAWYPNGVHGFESQVGEAIRHPDSVEEVVDAPPLATRRAFTN